MKVNRISDQSIWFNQLTTKFFSPSEHNFTKSLLVAQAITHFSIESFNFFFCFPFRACSSATNHFWFRVVHFRTIRSYQLLWSHWYEMVNRNIAHSTNDNARYNPIEMKLLSVWINICRYDCDKMCMWVEYVLQHEFCHQTSWAE